MAEPVKPPTDFHPPEANSCFLEIGISPSIGQIRISKNHEANRPQNIFRSDRDKELAHERELHRQERLERREKRKEQCTSDPEYLTGLDIKECVLDVQAMFLKQLAFEENDFKGLTEAPGLIATDLEKRKKEVEEAIQKLTC